MPRQRSSVRPPHCSARHAQCRVLLFLSGLAVGDRLLDVLQSKLPLIGIELLRALAEQPPLECAQHLAQAIVLIGNPVALGADFIALAFDRRNLHGRLLQQRTQRFRIGRQMFEVERHETGMPCFRLLAKVHC